MLDAAKIRVCPVVDTRVPDWSACRDTALPLKLAPEEKLLAYKRSFSYLSELDAPLCHGLYAQMERNIGDKVFGATNLNRNHFARCSVNSWSCNRTGTTFQPGKNHANSIRHSNQTYAAPFAWRAVARSGTGLNKYSRLDHVSRP
jgi:hypothetical protein